MNGDSLHDYFELLAPSGQSAYRHFVSRFYLYSFISLFIYTVYNLFWVRSRVVLVYSAAIVVRS